MSRYPLVDSPSDPPSNRGVWKPARVEKKFGYLSRSQDHVPEDHMGEFVAEMTRRIAEAQASIRKARAEGDDFLVEARTAEIEDLRHLAARNGVVLR